MTPSNTSSVCVISEILFLASFCPCHEEKELPTCTCLRFLKMHPNQSWAARDPKAEISVLQTTQPLFRKSEFLPTDVLSFSRVRDANHQDYSEVSLLFIYLDFDPTFR